MYLRDLLTAMLRRWYLTFVVVAGTVVLCFGALQVVPPSYETKANVLLVPPGTPEGPGNRFLALGSLTQAKDVLIRRLSSDQTAQDLKDEGYEGEFEVTADFTTAAPIIVITSSAETEEASSKLADALLDRTKSQLESLQSQLEIDAADQISQIVLSEGIPKPAGKARIRAMVAAVGVGLGGGLMTVGLIDGILVRRSARRRERVQEPRESRWTRQRQKPAPEDDKAPPKLAAETEVEPAAKSNGHNGRPATKRGPVESGRGT